MYQVENIYQQKIVFNFIWLQLFSKNIKFNVCIEIHMLCNILPLFGKKSHRLSRLISSFFVIPVTGLDFIISVRVLSKSEEDAERVVQSNIETVEKVQAPCFLKFHIQ